MIMLLDMLRVQRQPINSSQNGYFKNKCLHCVINIYLTQYEILCSKEYQDKMIKIINFSSPLSSKYILGYTDDRKFTKLKIITKYNSQMLELNNSHVLV